MALSYCWGKYPFMTTTTKTLNLRKECIKWGELPKTFQQAINITRNLKIRYLWIDALCIIQDDSQDWEVESPQMSRVYQGSYLTIAANHAIDANAGCFSDTKWLEKASYEIHPSSSARIRTLYREDHAEFSHAYARKRSSKPLTSRGWALQERLLSPRVIHYMAKELVWECNTLADCQCKGIHTMGLFKSAYSRVLTGMKDEAELTHHWIWIIEVYTAQLLTYQIDRLPALSGLVHQAKQAGAGQYAAGLWRRNLEHLTCWEVKEKGEATVRHAAYLGPSWSWVNILGVVLYPSVLQQHQIRAGVQNLILIKDLSVINVSEYSDSLIDASLKISGKYLDASLSLLTATISGKPGHLQKSYQLTTIHGSVYAGFVPDTPINNLWTDVSEIPIKILPWCFSPHNGGEMLFMVLSSAKDREGIDRSISRKGAFERLGMIKIKGINNKIKGIEGFEWYSKATAFENLIFV